MSENKQELSKLGLLLKERGITQHDFLEMILVASKGKIFYSKSALSLHVNGHREYMTTETAKIFAKTLGVTMEEVAP